MLESSLSPKLTDSESLEFNIGIIVSISSSVIFSKVLLTSLSRVVSSIIGNGLLFIKFSKYILGVLNTQQRRPLYIGSSFKSGKESRFLRSSKKSFREPFA